MPIGRGDRLYMGPIQPKDLAQVPDFSTFPADSPMVRYLSPFLKEDLESLREGGQYYDAIADESDDPLYYAWGWYVTTPFGQQLAGYSNIKTRDVNDNENAVQVINWNEANWHRGLATRANRAHLQYAYTVRNMGRLTCAAYEANIRSVDLFHKAGYETFLKKTPMFPAPFDPESLVVFMENRNPYQEQGDIFNRRQQKAKQRTLQGLQWAEENVKIAA